AKKPPPGGPPSARAPLSAKQARNLQIAWAKHLNTPLAHHNRAGVPLVLLPPGEFHMGLSPRGVEAALELADAVNVQLKKLNRKELLQRETPQHHVVLTRPIWCGITEVSIGQFKKFVTATRYVTQHEQELRDNKKLEDQNSWRAPGYPVKDTSPVTYVTWND